MATPSRPLSPHLQIYRWQISNTLSILNRITGIILSAAFVLFCGWLMAVASGPDAYDTLTVLLRGPLGVIALLGVAGSFFFHLLNGVRHLFWDVGVGFERPQARFSGWLVVAGTVLFTLALTLWVAA
jgi:succinate dehydrogenase / fumarate reductase cytochrome b subunit